MNLHNVFKSIQNTGGASYQLETGELNPSTGYMVAIEGHEKTFAAEISCTVDLDPSLKGVHMSRFSEIFGEAIDAVVIGEAFLVETLADTTKITRARLAVIFSRARSTGSSAYTTYGVRFRSMNTLSSLGW